jgi:hypothetical protein
MAVFAMPLPALARPCVESVVTVEVVSPPFSRNVRNLFGISARPPLVVAAIRVNTMYSIVTAAREILQEGLA